MLFTKLMRLYFICFNISLLLQFKSNGGIIYKFVEVLICKIGGEFTNEKVSCIINCNIIFDNNIRIRYVYNIFIGRSNNKNWIIF